MHKEPKYFVQRMDGVLLLSYLATETEVIQARLDFGKGKPVSPGVNAHGRINYFGYIWKDVHKQAYYIIKQIKKDKKYLTKLAVMWQERGKDLINFENKLARTNLRSLSDKSLSEHFYKLINLYQRQFGPALLCDPFSLHTEKIITDSLKKILKKRGEPRKFAEYLAILISPKKHSWAVQEEIDFLTIVRRIEKQKSITNVLKNNLRQGIKLISVKREIKKLFDYHTDKYYWIENSYWQGIKLDSRYFIKKARRVLLENLDINKKIKELINSNQSYKQKNKLIEKLNLEKNTRQLIEWIEFFGFLHDARKGMMMKTYTWVAHVLKEIARRLHLSLYEMYYTDYHQIGEMLLKKKVDKALIKKRMKMCAYIIKPHHYQILVGKKAEKWHNLLLGEEKTAVGDIKGVSASTGVVMGRAKIVKDIRDGHKLKKGDIIITGMTRPHWMSFLRLASGIVTDEGGITCHAAIVAREMGIPCIIGTKGATKVIKDNDLIEVNTNHNTVRILKRGKDQ